MRTSCLLALLVLLSPPASAGLVVVDPRGGDGAALLQAAIDAAQDGDVLLLKAGDYVGAGMPALSVAGRSISILADDGLAPLPIRSMNVGELPEGACLVLRGLRLATPQGGEVAGPGGTHLACSLDIAANGPPSLCWVEDCEILGAPDAVMVLNNLGCGGLRVSMDGPAPVSPGLAVVAVRSLITGAMTGVPFFGGGGDAVRLDGGVAALYECTLVGGEGTNVPLFGLVPANGGHAFIGLPGALTASGTSFQGGAEGLNNVQPATSGSALQLLFAISEAWLRGCTLQAGAVQGAAGTQGPVVNNPARDIVEFPAAPRSLAVPRVCRELAPGALSVHGLPGDLVGVMLSGTAAWTPPIPSRQGQLLLGGPLATPFVAGVITEADGALSVPFETPRLPAGLDALVLFAQGIFAGSDGVTLGSGSAFCWIAADA